MLYSAHSRLAVALAGLKSNARSEEGQGLIEYALIISLIAIVAIVALQATGNSISSILNKVSTDV